MRQKTVSLLFILSLVISQYGKIIGYVGCRINNLITTTATCDCEKQIKSGVTDNTQPISEKNSVREKFDEVYVIHQCPSLNFTQVPAGSPILTASAALFAGIQNSVFQPPQS